MANAIHAYRGTTAHSLTLSEPVYPRFRYKDNAQPLSQRYVMYWQYNAAEDDLHFPFNNPHYWDEWKKYLPVGLGVTDTEGYLKPILRVHGFRVKQDHDSAKHQAVYQRSRYRSYLDIEQYKRLHLDADFNTTYSVCGFSESKFMAFMVLPVDNEHLASLEIRNLVQFGQESEEVWYGKLDSTDAEVHIPCTLMEWDLRLQQAIKNLKIAQERFLKVTEPMQQDLVKLARIHQYLQCCLRFPLDASQRQVKPMQDLIEKVEDYSQIILEDYIQVPKKPSTIADRLAEFTAAAEALWSILKSEAFVVAIGKNALNHNAEEGREADAVTSLITIADTQAIYQTLTEAYQLLAQTPPNVSERVFAEHIDQLIRYVEHIADPVPEHPELRQRMAALYTDSNAGLSSADVETPLVKILRDWWRLTPNIVGNSPGPPSLAIAVVDAFGQHLAKKMAAMPSDADKRRALRRLFGILKIFNHGKPVATEHLTAVALLAVSGKLGSADEVFSKYCTEAADARSAIMSGKVHRFFIRTIIVLSLYFNVTAADSNSYRKFCNIINATANVGLTFSRSLSVVFSVSFERLVRNLSILGYLAGIASAGISIRNDNTSKVGYILQWVDVSFQVFGMWAYLAGSAWLIGLALAVGLSIAFYTVYVDLMRFRTHRGFMHLIEAVGSHQQRQKAYYLGNSRIDLINEEINDLAAQLDWWPLSWRAVIPLYEIGFRIIDPATGKPDIPAIAELISGIVTMSQDFRTRKGRRNMRLKRMTEIGETTKLLKEYFSLVELSSRKTEYTKVVNDWCRGYMYPNRKPTPLLLETRL